MVGNLPRRLVAEAVGTMLLVIFGAGAVVAALLMGDGELTYAALGFISLSFALVVALVIYAFGTTSGAHINPAVTIALAAGGRFPWREVAPYVAAQLMGAFAGGLLIVGGFGRRAADLGTGLTALGEGVSYGQGILLEVMGTFLLMLTIMAMAVDRRAPSGWAGWIIGMAVACEIFVIGPMTGGAVNPARTFGPYLTTSVFGGDTPWAQFGVYVIGPVAGALLAVLVYDQVARPFRELPETAGQGTGGEIAGAREPGGADPVAEPAADPVSEEVAKEVPPARPPGDEQIRQGRPPRRPGRGR